jgi:iron complex transport system ATP-binding protein
LAPSRAENGSSHGWPGLWHRSRGRWQAIFELLRELGRSGVTVLLVTHNLNLAARYADRLVLLSGGRVVSEGAPSDVLNRDLVEEVYGWPVDIRPLTGRGAEAGTPQVVPLRRDATAGGAERGEGR